MELHYLDIRLQGERTTQSATEGSPSQVSGSSADAIPVAALSSRALCVLHGAFTQYRIESGAQPYALALPQGLEILRVFCASRDALDALADRTEQHRFMRDYMVYGRIRRAYTTDETQWVEYRRYRIPNRNAIAAGDHEKENMARRDSRIKHALKLPHFVMSSKSTRQIARVFVEQQNWTQDIPEALTPDSWGLSRLSARFALPVM